MRQLTPNDIVSLIMKKKGATYHDLIHPASQLPQERREMIADMILAYRSSLVEMWRLRDIADHLLDESQDIISSDEKGDIKGKTVHDPSSKSSKPR
jgi:hypothetical protein